MEHNTHDMPQSQAAGLPTLRIYRVGYVAFNKLQAGNDAVCMRLDVDEYVFYWFAGEPEEGDFLINEREPLHWKRGDLLLGHPGDVIAITGPSRREISGLLIGFSVERPAQDSEHRGWPRLRAGLNSHSAFPPLLRYCLQVSELPEPRRTTLLSSALGLMLQMFVSGTHEQGPASPLPASLPRPLAAAVSALIQPEADLAGLTAHALALHAGVTSDYLTRLAKESFGVTLQQLIQLQRLERACELLSGSELTVKEISHRCGFVHPPYFTRHFMKVLGCTPSEYRLRPAAERPEASRPITAILQSHKLITYASIHLYARCGAPSTPAELLKTLDNELRQEQQAYPGIRTPAAHWQPVTLKGKANRSRLAGPEGWIGCGYSLTQLPAGRKCVHGITFDILDDGVTEGRSVLMMRSAALRSHELPQQVRIPIVEPVRSLAILHAASWAAALRQPVAEYEAEFADGQRECIPVWTAGDPPLLDQDPMPLLQDWWPTYAQFDHASARKVTVYDPANPLGSIRYLYTYLWRNPRPNVPLKAWHIHTTGQQQATLAILAVSILPA